MTDELIYGWRTPLSDDEMVELVDSHGGRSSAGWWDRIRPHSLGWVTARTTDGTVVGFVNTAWDGGDHAFLLDTKTRGDWQRRGIATELVRRAAHHAKAAGCELVPDEILVPLAGVGLVRLRAKVEEHGLFEVFGRPTMEQGVEKTDDRK